MIMRIYLNNSCAAIILDGIHEGGAGIRKNLVMTQEKAGEIPAFSE
jgi:hypothetical protein